MKRLIYGWVLCLMATSALAQQPVRELQLKYQDFTALSTRVQEQFKEDYKVIMADEKLKQIYATEAKSATSRFTGTTEERSRILARIARSVVVKYGPEEESTSPTRPAGVAPVTTEMMIDGSKVINRAISVTPDVLMKADEKEEETSSSGSDKLNGTRNPSDPQPLNPGSSSTNVFQGHLAYEIPDTMEVGETERVRLVVSIDPEVARQLAERGEGDMYSSEIGIGRYLKARLDDYDSFGPEDKNFRFQLFQGDSIQVIDPDNPASSVVWEWKVRPLSAGIHTIGVVVSIIVFDDRLPNNRAYKSLDTYEQAIQILANPAGEENSTDQAITGLPTKPTRQSKLTPLQIMLAIGGVLILGVGAFFAARFFRTRTLRRQAAEAEGTQQQVFASTSNIPDVRQGDGHADPKEIHALILAGEFDKAAGELMDLAELRDYPDKASIIAMQARIRHWQSDVYNNIIDGESARQERSRITLALVKLLESIDDESS